MDEAENVNLSQDQTRVPLTNIHRLLKKGIPPYGKASKDAKQAAQDILQEFISFVTSEAKGITQRERRKVLGGNDILVALENLGMKRYSAILKEYQKSYHKAVAEVPSGSDGESGAVSDAIDDDIDVTLHDCSSQADCERFDDLLSNNLSEAHVSLGLSPIAKAIPSSSSLENSRPAVAKVGFRTRDENSNADLTEFVERVFHSRSPVTKKPSVAIGSTSFVHHTVKIPALTIPAALVCGIRVPPIDIPELTVPVELVSGLQLATTSGHASLSMNGQQMVVNANELFNSKSDLQEEHRPSTEVIDLISPTHAALQLLDSDALDPLDFNPFLEGEFEMETLTKNLRSSL